MQLRKIALMLALVVTAAIDSPALAQSDRSEFDATVFYTSVPSPGDVSCPGGAAPLPSPMPPWCLDGRTRVRDRMLTGGIIQSSDPRVFGVVTVVMNMNLDARFEGPAWGTYRIDVPGRGTWEGVWQGKYRGPTFASYRLVAHGSGEFEGLELRASLVRQAGKGESLTGEIIAAR